MNESSNHRCAKARLWRRVARAEYGAAAVEMAVSISVLLMVVVGLMKVCLAVYSYHYISEASREGARYAIVHGTTNAVSDDDLKTYVKGLAYPAISAAAMTVTVARSGFPTGVTCAPLANCTNPGNMVTITVNYAFPLAIPFRASQTLNMSSTAAAIISQ